MADTRWLERRHLTWHCVKEVPRPLRKMLGKKRLVASLQTHDLSVAMARRWEALASFERTIQAASRATGEDTAVHAGLAWRETIKRIEAGDAATIKAVLASGSAWQSERNSNDLTEREAALIQADWSLGDHIDHVAETKGATAAVTLHQVARGKATPLLVYVEDWLAEGGAKGPLKDRTKGQYRTDIGRLATWMRGAGLPETVEAVTRTVAGRFVRETIVTPKVDPKTGNRWISAISAYWRWMGKRTDLQVNPWMGQNVAKGPQGEDEAGKRPFTDTELRTLLDGDPGVELADLIRVAALSGMRIEEIYRLTVADCAGGWFNLRQAKTKAGVRKVPVHSALADIVERRCKGKAATAYLFHEPGGPAKPGRERSMPASKRFGRYRQDVGVHERGAKARSSAVDFHSFRRWFATAARNAGQDQAMVAAILGHQVGNLTDDTYSGGPSDERRRAVVESVKLP